MMVCCCTVLLETLHDFRELLLNFRSDMISTGVYAVHETDNEDTEVDQSLIELGKAVKAEIDLVGSQRL